jgi:hypothetical protein
VEGVDKIVSTQSLDESMTGTPWFDIVFCDDCGHIYGVFAKNVYSHNMPPMPVNPQTVDRWVDK